ncbi:MAG: hypothetical protein ACREQ2_05390 [Candidatus Binatia bacterium]
MKAFLLGIGVLTLVALAAPDSRAQAYDPYYGPSWDLQYQQYLAWQQHLDYWRQNDPYYELHVMHYQLYRPPYPSHFVYTPCCYAVGIPTWSAPFRRMPHRASGRGGRAVRGR